MGSDSSGVQSLLASVPGSATAHCKRLHCVHRANQQGIDVLHPANYGMFGAAVGAASRIRLVALGAQPGFADAAVIGLVVRHRRSPLAIQRRPGNIHALDEPCDAPVPRIC